MTVLGDTHTHTHTNPASPYCIIVSEKAEGFSPQTAGTSKKMGGTRGEISQLSLVLERENRETNQQLLTVICQHC